jgi:uncharacterized membrane protein YfhO
MEQANDSSWTLATNVHCYLDIIRFRAIDMHYIRLLPIFCTS